MNDIEIPEGFTRWDGENEAGPAFEILLRNGRVEKCTADEVSWLNGTDGPDYDIIAYRVLP